MEDGNRTLSPLEVFRLRRREERIRAKQGHGEQKLSPVNQLEEKSMSEVVTLTKQDFQEMMIAILKAAKEPSAEEQSKIDEAKKREAKNKADFVQMVKQEQDSKTYRQNACGHKKENGRFSTGGQVIGGRFALLLCSHCQRAWYKAFPAETLAQLNSGDLVLFGADPAGWQDAPPADSIAA